MSRVAQALQSWEGALGLRVRPRGFWQIQRGHRARGEHIHSTCGMGAMWQGPHPSLTQTPHTVNTPHHAMTTAHTCGPQPGLERMQRKGRRGGLWAVPSHLALILPSPPSISFSSYPAQPGSGLHSHLVSLRPPQRPGGAGVSVLERKV